MKMINYIESKHIDKSQWLGGPWMYEPDFVSFIDNISAYKCEIHRIEGPGHLCGYVSTPADHPLADVDESSYEIAECHGGITYKEKFNKGADFFKTFSDSDFLVLIWLH